MPSADAPPVLAREAFDALRRTRSNRQRKVVQVVRVGAAAGTAALPDSITEFPVSSIDRAAFGVPVPKASAQMSAASLYYGLETPARGDTRRVLEATSYRDSDLAIRVHYLGSTPAGARGSSPVLQAGHGWQRSSP